MWTTFGFRVGFFALAMSIASPARAQDPSEPAPAESSPAPEIAPVPARAAPAPAPSAAPPAVAAPQPAPVPAPAATAPQLVDVSPDAYEDAEQPRSRWYGWQTLIADGVVIGSLVMAGASDSPDSTEFFIYAALGGYLLAAPTIHFTHGNTGRGFASLGIRVGLPLVVGLAVNEATDCQGDFCGFGALLFGAFGALGAMALDAALLAYEPEDESAFRLAPVIGLNQGVTFVGARGVF